MLTHTEKQFSILFFIIVLIELLSSSTETLQKVHYIAKPAIVISLIFLFLKTSKNLSIPLKKTTVVALVSSLLGDILLMFVAQSAHFFIFGLLAFLFAHIMYILVFLKHRNENRSVYMILILLIAYASGVFYLLQSGLGEMLIPVVIYMVVILTMGATAYLRKNKANKISYYFVLAGAIFFIISDSILALNKFYHPIAYANLGIMVSYALAQYLIVFGILKISVTNSNV